MAEPWMKFYTSDWRSDPRLKMCSAGARGVWIEMICLMHEATPYGQLLVHGQTPNEAQLASLTGIPLAELNQYMAELEQMGVFSRTKEGVIYSRKLVRMAAKSAKARKNGKKGGNPSLGKEREKEESVNPPDKGMDKPQKPEARSQIKIEGDDAGVRASDITSAPPDEPDPPNLPGWRRLNRQSLLEAMGADPVSGLVGTNGRQIGGLADMQVAGAWIDDLGLTPDEVMAVVAEVMTRKPDGPPASFKYFTNEMQRLAGQKLQAPLTPISGGNPDEKRSDHRLGAFPNGQQNRRDPVLENILRLAGAG